MHTWAGGSTLRIGRPPDADARRLKNKKKKKNGRTVWTPSSRNTGVVDASINVVGSSNSIVQQLALPVDER
jgi:hypothetical protein